MNIENFVHERIDQFFCTDDLTCTVSTLKILSEHFQIDVPTAVYDAAIGMHGAGQSGAQCGLVEGALMFLGIIGRQRGIDEEDIITACADYAALFEKRLGSLICSILRPEGFSDDNPPHLCRERACVAVLLDIDFIDKFLSRQNKA